MSWSHVVSALGGLLVGSTLWMRMSKAIRDAAVRDALRGRDIEDLKRETSSMAERLAKLEAAVAHGGAKRRKNKKRRR